MNGDGLEIACTEYLTDPKFRGIKVVGVGFPHGTVPPPALQVPERRQTLFQEFNVPILRAACPFDDRVRRTLELFSGGMSLCVWGVLVACDSGAVMGGEHVIACSGDTSVIVKAAPSSHFFSSLVIREVVCKPLIHDISKGESLAEEVSIEEGEKALGGTEPKRLSGSTAPKKL